MLQSCFNFRNAIQIKAIAEGPFQFNNMTRAQAIIDMYPKDQRQNAVIPLLHLAQEQNGYINTDAFHEIARLTGTHVQKIQDTASYYPIFHFQPLKKHIVEICHGLSCSLHGTESIITAIEEACNGSFEVGESKDGKFILEEVECLGACASAPTMVIDGVFYKNVTKEMVTKIINNLKQDLPPL